VLGVRLLIRRLVDDFCRRDKPPERRNEFQFRGRKLSASEAVPFAEIAAPAAGPVVGMHRRYKPREDGARRVPRGNLHNPRQHAFHPWRFPDAAPREDVLNVDGEMRGIGYRFNLRGNRHSA
jgi:hypothetical protein